MRQLAIFSILFLIATFFSHSLKAHDPFYEESDYSCEKPFRVKGSIENARAVFARLEPPTDIDVYAFTVSQPVHIHARAFVPCTAHLNQFLPSLAVVGPGLPAPAAKVPFPVPEGYGAVIVNNTPPGKKRPTFYEPFSGETYYDAPAFDQQFSTTGTWYIYYWDPYKMGGDYVAILGFKEKLW